MLKNILKSNILTSINKKIITCFIMLFIFSSKVNALEPNDSNVLSKIIDRFLDDTLDWVLLGGAGLISITCICRVVSEFMKGGSKYRFYDIGKFCIIALLMIFTIPFLPTLIKGIVSKYTSTLQ